MAFTNKKFSQEDKKAIVDQIVKSDEIKEIMATAVKSKLDNILGVKPTDEQPKTAPAIEEEGDTVYVTISGVKYKLEEVDVLISPDSAPKKVKLLVPFTA